MEKNIYFVIKIKTLSYNRRDENNWKAKVTSRTKKEETTSIFNPKLSATGCTTPPCGGYNVNPYCPWTNPGCNNNGYSTTYYSMPIFNGFTYASDWPGQYYGNTITYNAFYPNQQGYCNNNYYGYCKQQQKLSWQTTSANLIIDNYSWNDINPYYHNKKPQKLAMVAAKIPWFFPVSKIHLTTIQIKLWILKLAFT
ncbi:hypothetical protein [Arsenophonus endosymbiont of Bemisia tabaci]|uniref:hypothetical protein n=1 Tax=Arsenophonus endosymbiont of Bemisia tabaci TaxID=536059 RepID=UPI0015F3A6CE|nr:hypothetical protein [Arsenophonus endosymbiont of Bemisia tabaci]CAA2929386.1 hypothetical protein ARSQ2_00473 [Arsenophonus endosymbiont of Bemisia tabaci Q2]